MIPFRNKFDTEFSLVSQGKITKVKKTLLPMLKFNLGIIMYEGMPAQDFLL